MFSPDYRTGGQSQCNSHRFGHAHLPRELWVPHPCRHSRPGGMGPWAAWAGGGQPCPWLGVALGGLWAPLQPEPFCVLWYLFHLIATHEGIKPLWARNQKLEWVMVQDAADLADNTKAKKKNNRGDQRKTRGSVQHKCGSQLRKPYISPENLQAADPDFWHHRTPGARE